MFRQTLSAPSKAISAGLRLAAQRPIVRAQLFAAPIAASRTVGLQQRARWYSESKDAEAKEAEPKEAAKEEGEAKETPEAALRKQLEAKEAEVRDWKVG
jgi:molecular chaperone GrpE